MGVFYHWGDMTLEYGFHFLPLLFWNVTSQFYKQCTRGNGIIFPWSQSQDYLSHVPAKDTLAWGDHIAGAGGDGRDFACGLLCARHRMIPRE